MSSPILAGAEPFSAAGGRPGCSSCTASPATRSRCGRWRRALAEAGLTVEAPLLPGHGTSVDGHDRDRWSDWSAAAEAAYLDLAGRCEKVAVVGLSMGGTLAAGWPSATPRSAGLPSSTRSCGRSRPTRSTLCGPMARWRGRPSWTASARTSRSPDVASSPMPDTGRAAAVAARGGRRGGAKLADIACPVLLFSSRDDHVVPPSQRRRPRGVGTRVPVRAGVAGAQLPRRHPRLRPRGDQKRAR
jgi:carboxylesterase